MPHAPSRSRRLRLLQWLVPFALALLASGPAGAVSSGFVAQLTSVSTDTLGTGLTAGSTLGGDFTAGACAVADASCLSFYGIDPQVGGLYFDFNLSLELRLPGLTVVAGPSGPDTFADSTILNQDPGSGSDSYSLDATSLNAFDLDNPLAGAWTVLLNLSLTDVEGLALDHGADPSKLTPFSQYESSSFQVSVFAPGGLSFEASGVLIALPEPSSALMVGLGLLGFAARRRRVLRSRV